MSLPGARTTELPSEVHQGRAPCLSLATSSRSLNDSETHASENSKLFYCAWALGRERTPKRDAAARLRFAHHASERPPSTMFFYKRRQRVSYLAQEENARICLHRGEAPSNTEAYCLLTHRLIGKVLRLGVLAQALNRKSFRLRHHARRGQILLRPG